MRAVREVLVVPVVEGGGWRWRGVGLVPPGVVEQQALSLVPAEGGRNRERKGGICDIHSAY